MASVLGVTPLAGVWVEMGTKLYSGEQMTVTPLAGVWVEIAGMLPVIPGKTGSLPLRECGLKYRITRHHPAGCGRSLPLRECGLKFFHHRRSNATALVTPLAGVWVEIGAMADNIGAAASSSLPLRECGLK